MKFLAMMVSFVVAVDASAASVESPVGQPAKVKRLSRLSVTANPRHIDLALGEEWSQTTYVFTNHSEQHFEVLERSAFFHSLKGDWQSGIIGPFPTVLKVPALSEIEWQDRPFVRAQMVEQARQAEALDHKELLFVQNFTLRSSTGELTHASTTIIYRIDGEPPATERLTLRHFEATVLSDLRKDPVKESQLIKLIEFADASYEKLSLVVGFVPNGGKKVPLRISSYGGFPHYQGGAGSFVNIPCDVLESQSTSEWLFVAFPHELTHYFLLEEFPNPPRWFVEGPASFFGTKVAEELGYGNMAKEDRKKITEWGADYARKQHQYLFTADWPRDGGKAGDGYALGLGRGYELCVKLEELCGREFFPKVFQHMRDAQISFSNAKTEQERNEILIGAMQTQTSHDLWDFFAREGFVR